MKKHSDLFNPKSQHHITKIKDGKWLLESKVEKIPVKTLVGYSNSATCDEIDFRIKSKKEKSKYEKGKRRCWYLECKIPTDTRWIALEKSDSHARICEELQKRLKNYNFDELNKTEE